MIGIQAFLTNCNKSLQETKVCRTQGKQKESTHGEQRENESEHIKTRPK